MPMREGEAVAFPVAHCAASCAIHPRVSSFERDSVDLQSYSISLHWNTVCSVMHGGSSRLVDVDRCCLTSCLGHTFFGQTLSYRVRVMDCYIPTASSCSGRVGGPDPRHDGVRRQRVCWWSGRRCWQCSFTMTAACSVPTSLLVCIRDRQTNSGIHSAPAPRQHCPPQPAHCFSAFSVTLSILQP
jgi:hypothetical protein